MTREEALDKWVLPALQRTWNEKKVEEILKALEQEPDAIHNEREQAYMKGYEDASKRYRKEPCEDCISRAEVLKALGDLPHDYKTTEQRARTGGIAACQAIVRELLSVTPKPKAESEEV